MRILILWLSAAAWCQQIAPPASTVEAIVEKTGLMSGKTHVLRWQQFSGSFSASPARVELTVESASLQVLDDWISESKKEDVKKETLGKAVLDAAKYPQIHFTATAINGDPNTGFQIPGTLTIRGIAKPVVLSVKRNGNIYEGETRFPMSSFGIKPPKALLGAIGTKDEMKIRFTVAETR